MKNNFLNIIKAISAFSVIIIHCNFPNTLGIIMDALARYAVPIFFMISGYYCYKTENQKISDNLKRKIRNVIKVIIIAHVIYFIWNIKDFILDLTQIKLYISNIINIKTMANLLLFNVSPLSDHLWFMWALLYCYIFLLVINKYDLYKKMNLFIIILMLINISLGEILSSIGILIPVYFIRNFLFVGIPFFMLGMLIHQHKDTVINSINNKMLIIVCILFNIILVFERMITDKNDLYISSIVVAISLFLLAIKNPNLVRCKLLEKIGDKFSELIYLYHPIAIIIVNKVGALLSINNLVVYHYLEPIIVILMSCIGAYIVYRIRMFYKRINISSREVIEN